VRCAKIHGRQGHADRFYLEGDAIDAQSSFSVMKARVARIEVALAQLRESFRDDSGAARWGLRGFAAFTVAESGQSSSIPHNVDVYVTSLR
jgi:hypothetical protein